jgi:L-asparaginase
MLSGRSSMIENRIRVSVRRRTGVAAVLLALVAGVSCLVFAPNPSVAQPAPADSRAAAPLPRILVLATGGTIAGVADPRAAGAYKAGAISAEQLLASVPALEKIVSLKAEQVSSIGSQDMNDTVWFTLARRIQKAFDSKEVDGVVITHGTDTLEETAFFLDNVLRVDGPVVLVGSMRSSTALSADGPGNLYAAMQVAASPQSQKRGVVAVLNEKIEGARGVSKSNTTSVETFNSPNTGPVGYVDSAGGIRYLHPVIESKRARFELPDTPPLPRVDIIYSHANMDALPIESAIANRARGIVLAGVGDGNTSKAALDALEKAAKDGIVVVRSTRVRSGFVTRNVEVDDDKSGFIVSEDLNPQKARILTQLLIASGVNDRARMQEAFRATW